MMALLNYPQAAEWLGISQRSLARLVQSGKVPMIRIGARSIRFDEQALREAVTKMSVIRATHEQPAA